MVEIKVQHLQLTLKLDYYHMLFLLYSLVLAYLEYLYIAHHAVVQFVVAQKVKQHRAGDIFS